jgi:poly(3-hydroxybutyrate) depolymerase
MGFKGFLFLIFLAVSTRVQGKMACADAFVKNTVDLTNGTFHSVSVGGTKRELLIFEPTQTTSTPAPVMIYFHGTNSPLEFSRPLDAAYGLAHENSYIQALTHAGFVVIAPTANRIVPFYVGAPVLAWEANVSPYSSYFERGRDFQLAEYLLKNLEDFSSVSIDRENIFLSGFSSGGYMSSRLAQEAVIARQIRGIVVHSASYGECLASHCYVPTNLPGYHPPTLLVANKDDSIVPFYTVELYQARLRANKIPQQSVFANTGDHAWKKHHGPRVIEWLKEKRKKN